LATENCAPLSPALANRNIGTNSYFLLTIKFL
jgi:hypothetical protein